MKLKLIAALASILCLSAGALAQDSADQTGGSDVGAKQGMYFAPEVIGFFTDKSRIDDGTFVGGRLGYQFCPPWAVELESGWVKMDITENMGDVQLVPFLFNARYDFLQGDGPLGIIAIGGLGWSWNEANSDVADVSLDTSFVGQAGLGLEYRFSNELSAVVDVRYFWSDAEVDIRQVDDASEVNLNSMLVGGSLVWHF